MFKECECNCIYRHYVYYYPLPLLSLLLSTDIPSVAAIVEIS